MKKIIVMLGIALGMSSCQKDSTPGTVENPAANVPDSSIYVNLVVQNYFSQTYTKYYQRNNLIDSTGQIGYVYYLGDPHGNNVTLFLYDDGRTNLSGNHNGHSWIVWEGVVNVCNGPQGLNYTLTLDQHINS
jgi:hypothetical protein